MLALIALGVTVAAAVAGYVNTRRFVRHRLRYVDAVQRTVAPFVAGAAASLVAAPIVWLVPVLGLGTALLFGFAVGTGVAHGARDVRRSGAGLLEP